MKVQKKERMRRVLSRLEAQLKSGKKPEKLAGKTTTKLVELTDKDKTRITKEIETLNKAV